MYFPKLTSQDAINSFFPSLTNLSKLTPIQLKILQVCSSVSILPPSVEGFTMKELAKRLDISYATVRRELQVLGPGGFGFTEALSKEGTKEKLWKAVDLEAHFIRSGIGVDIKTGELLFLLLNSDDPAGILSLEGEDKGLSYTREELLQLLVLNSNREDGLKEFTESKDVQQAIVLKENILPLESLIYHLGNTLVREFVTVNSNIIKILLLNAVKLNEILGGSVDQEHMLPGPNYDKLQIVFERMERFAVRYMNLIRSLREGVLGIKYGNELIELIMNEEDNEEIKKKLEYVENRGISSKRLRVLLKRFKLEETTLVREVEEMVEKFLEAPELEALNFLEHAEVKERELKVSRILKQVLESDVIQRAKELEEQITIKDEQEDLEELEDE